MIIDLILDRKDTKKYDPKKFYNNILEYGKIGYKIADALDYGENKDIKKALCDYIDQNDYNENIKKYINNQNWL